MKLNKQTLTIAGVAALAFLWLRGQSQPSGPSKPPGETPASSQFGGVQARIRIT